MTGGLPAVEQLGALLRLGHVAARLLQALEVALRLLVAGSARRGRRRAARARAAGSGPTGPGPRARPAGSGDAAQDAAGRLGELVERPRVGRWLDGLGLV